MKKIQLIPIKELPSDYEEIEKEIVRVLRREIYLPLILMLKASSEVLQNSRDDLLDAIATGRITFYRGKFSGQFNSRLSRALRSIGAEWERKTGCFSLPHSKLPAEVQHAIEISESRFARVVEGMNRQLSAAVPAEIAGKVELKELLDRTLWVTNKRFEASIRKITVAPKLTTDQSARIAEEYTNNLQLYIQDFAEKEITELRKNIQERVVAGERYENVVAEIQKSYGVTKRKAKFLARQETSLMQTKFKQVRYESVGADTYIWRCVHNTKDKVPDEHVKGNVRYYHGLLDGKVFRWDTGGTVNGKGERKNPGQDFNCRCYAVPIVKF